MGLVSPAKHLLATAHLLAAALGACQTQDLVEIALEPAPETSVASEAGTSTSMDPGSSDTGTATHETSAAAGTSTSSDAGASDAGSSEAGSSSTSSEATSSNASSGVGSTDTGSSSTSSEATSSNASSGVSSTDTDPATTSGVATSSSNSETAGVTESTSTSSGTAGASSGAATGDGGSSTGDDAGATDDGGGSSTGGDTDGETLECCEPGCISTMQQGHPGSSAIQIAANRLLSHDYGVKSILWDRTSRTPIRVERGWVYAELAGDLFYVADLDTMRWFDAADGAFLAETASGVSRGVAIDGSYVWIGSPGGLTVFDRDGVEQWFEPGDFSNTNARALPGVLHVASATVSVDSALVIDLLQGEVVEIPFSGYFAGWFADSGRFFTGEGQAYRIYDADGSQLALGLGGGGYGAGGYFMLNHGVRAVEAPNQILIELSPNWRTSGGAILELDADPRLIELGAASLGETAVVLPIDADEMIPGDLSGFAYEAGDWVVSGNDGFLVDQYGASYTRRRFTDVDGALSGRVAAASVVGATHVWDVGDDCMVLASGEIERLSATMTIADAGNVLASVNWADGALGTRFLSLPDGAELGVMPGGAFGSPVPLSDDGSTFARHNAQGPAWASVHSFPGFEQWAEFGIGLPIYVAPGGEHVVGAEHDQTWNGPERTYVVNEDGLIALLDGLAYGFLDDERLVLGHYVSQNCQGWPCEVYVGADIVELDGTLVQQTTLPAVVGFERISATELFVDDPPRVFDAYSGELLWEGEGAVLATAVGLDFIVTSDGGELLLHRWR